MSAKTKETLIKATECDRESRFMEAQMLYLEGIEALRVCTGNVTDSAKKKAFCLHIKEYLDRAEALKMLVQKQQTPGESIATLSIADNETGHNYETLFGAYLKEDLKEILLEEPYLDEKYQFQNLIMFFELTVKKCPKLTFISLITKPRETARQTSCFDQIKGDLATRGITLEITYQDTLHDRKIYLSNGYIIKIGRGLHIFKPNQPHFSLGLTDYTYRKCLQTEIQILHTKYRKS